MSTMPPAAPVGVRHRPAAVNGLAALLALLAVGAVQGGLAMVLHPREPLGMPVEFLERTPLDSYTLPGVFLLAIAAASALTVAGLLLPWRWPWAASVEWHVGYRWPWVGALATASILLVFEVMEVYMVPFHPIMHPLLIAGSVAILGLVFASSTRSLFRVGASPRHPDVSRLGLPAAR